MDATSPRVRASEPEERGRLPRRTVLVVLGALAAGVLGFLAGPDPWVTGDGTLRLVLDGREVLAEPVTVGSTDPFSMQRDGIELTATEGFPAQEPVRIELRIVDPAIALRLDATDLTLTLPDGRSEVLPVTTVDADGAVAVRRPPRDARPVTALLGVVVVLWVTELVPLFVTSLLIPIVLVVATGTSAADALSPFFHPIIALFFGGFLMAEAMRRVHLDRRIALTLVARAAHSPVVLFGALLGVSSFLSMWMSNTAAVALLIPIVLAITEPIDHPGYRRVVVLGIAYAATIGGVGSLIGTPANPIAVEFLGDLTGRRISFAEWFLVGLPMVGTFLPVMGVYLWWRGGVEVDATRFREVRTAARDELGRLGSPTRDQLVVLGVFVLVASVWLTQTFHGIDAGIVAVGGAVLLAVLGRIRQEDLGRISWASLLTFGGGLALGFALTGSGTSDWIATRLGGLSSLPDGLAVALVALVALGTTTVASNTATAATFVPLAIPLAGVLGVDPTLLVLTVAVASSVDFALVIGTPPTMLAYSTGLFTPAQILRTGGALDLVGIALLVTVVTAAWQALGVV